MTFELSYSGAASMSVDAMVATALLPTVQQMRTMALSAPSAAAASQGMQDRHHISPAAVSTTHAQETTDEGKLVSKTVALTHQVVT